MKCPQCSQSTLALTKLEPSLAGVGCGQCGGTLLSLVSYRLWRERHLHEATESATLESVPEETGKALLCGKCQHVMLRFRYTVDTKHVLDVCTHCEDVFLQEHEWAFLKARSLHGDLPHIFTDPWQKQRRSEQQQVSMHDAWDRRLGPELHAEMNEMRDWLDEHPQRDAVLSYLSIKDPYQV